MILLKLCKTCRQLSTETEKYCHKTNHQKFAECQALEIDYANFSNTFSNSDTLCRLTCPNLLEARGQAFFYILYAVYKSPYFTFNSNLIQNLIFYL